MNKSDSERIVSLLTQNGWEPTSSENEADLIIANTCSVRQTAEDRVFGMAHKWQGLKTKKPGLIIAITGCMPGRDQKDVLRKKLPGVDLFFPIQELPLLISRIRTINPDLISADSVVSDYLSIDPARVNAAHAFVAIQTGCNNFCTYCVVPYARGREQNRGVKDILREIEVALKNGAQEIWLLGQVVNNYKAPEREEFSANNPYREKDDFAALLYEINQLPGEWSLQWTAADPQYLNEHQISVLALPHQANALHLPVQSGSNSILKKMNRHYTREQYLEKIKKIRSLCPDIAIGTDIIVGFCSETPEQFEETLDLYRQADFDISYPAQYSQRSGTVAAKAFKDDVSREEKKRRWEMLQALMEETTLRRNQRFLNRTVTVIVDDCREGICSGYTPELKYTQFLGGSELLGKTVKVKITWVDTWLLRGELV